MLWVWAETRRGEADHVTFVWWDDWCEHLWYWVCGGQEWMSPDYAFRVWPARHSSVILLECDENEVIKKHTQVVISPEIRANVKQERTLPALRVCRSISYFVRLTKQALAWSCHNWQVNYFCKLELDIDQRHPHLTLTAVDLICRAQAEADQHCQWGADSELFNSDLNIAAFRGNQ